MAGLAGVLANIPGLAGWEAGNQMGQQNQVNQLRQVQGVMGLQQALQAQAEKQRASQVEQQFRAEIANARTPEEQLKVAAKYMGPDALGRMVQGSQDKQAQIAATKEATMARLQQAANQFEANYQMRLRSATTQEERLNLDRQREAFRQSLQSEAARLAGAQANYNFGFLPNTPPAPTVTPPQPAPNGQTVQGQFGDVSVNLQNASPALMAAARAQPEAQGSPELMTALGGAPAAPTAPRPAPAPVAPQPTPTPQPAPAASLPPMPPEVAAMPKKYQDKWRQDQIKQAGKSPAERAAYQAGLRDIQKDERDLANVSQMENAINRWEELNSKVPTGRVVGLRPAIGQPEFQEMLQLQNYLAVNNFKPGQGQISNFERQLIKGAGPSVNNDEEANRNIINVQRGAIQTAKERAAFREAYLEAKGKLLGADKIWSEYIEANPRYTRDENGNVVPNAKRKPWTEYFRSTLGATAPSGASGEWSVVR